MKDGTIHREAGPQGPSPGGLSKTPIRPWPVPPVLYHGVKWFLGGMFLLASYDKILHPEAFALAIYNYQMLPDAGVNIAALVLPWLELVIGLCLVSGRWMPGAAVLSTLLLAVFLGALAFNQWRGLDVYCGCFTTGTKGGPADLWTVLRDFVFLALSVYLTRIVVFPRSARTVSTPPNADS
jgi:hypothetical protein